jgi:hypothetical protein
MKTVDPVIIAPDPTGVIVPALIAPPGSVLVPWLWTITASPPIFFAFVRTAFRLPISYRT